MDAEREAQQQIQSSMVKGEPRIESKEHLWKPAPIVGRDFNQQEV